MISSRFPVCADRFDHRDMRCKIEKTPLKEFVDLRIWASPVEDQLSLGSCTGQAVIGAYELLLRKQQPEKFIDLSRLFVYYNARLVEGDEFVGSDNGAYVRNAIKAAREYGACAEALWPYTIKNFAIAPPVHTYEDAKRRIIKNYYRVDDVDAMLDALNAGYPIVASMDVYESFDDLETSSDYILKMPQGYDQLIGGHALTLVGYDLQKKLMLARNSFGSDWCMDGYFWIPFAYIKNYFMDNWIFDIELI